MMWYTFNTETYQIVEIMIINHHHDGTGKRKTSKTAVTIAGRNRRLLLGAHRNRTKTYQKFQPINWQLLWGTINFCTWKGGWQTYHHQNCPSKTLQGMPLITWLTYDISNQLSGLSLIGFWCKNKCLQKMSNNVMTSQLLIVWTIRNFSEL